jgi:hypothetical protein
MIALPLQTLIHTIEPAAYVVDQRILRRVIRLDRRLPGLGFSVPHRQIYTIDRDRLLAHVDRGELDLPPNADLPRTVILLAEQDDDESLLTTTPGW